MSEHNGSSRIRRMAMLYDLLKVQEDLKRGSRDELNKLIERTEAYFDDEELAKIRHEVSTKM